MAIKMCLETKTRVGERGSQHGGHAKDHLAAMRHCRSLRGIVHPEHAPNASMVEKAAQERGEKQGQVWWRSVSSDVAPSPLVMLVAAPGY